MSDTYRWVHSSAPMGVSEMASRRSPKPEAQVRFLHAQRHHAMIIPWNKSIRPTKNPFIGGNAIGATRNAVAPRGRTGISKRKTTNAQLNRTSPRPHCDRRAFLMPIGQRADKASHGKRVTGSITRQRTTGFSASIRARLPRRYGRATARSSNS